MFGEEGDGDKPADDAAAGDQGGEGGGDGGEAPSVQEMQEGEYQLHVLIENGQDMILEGDDQVDPLIKVKWCGKEGQSATKKSVTKTTKVKWDEHVFLDSGKLSKEEINDSRIEFQIQNYGFFKSEQIGLYSMATASLYSQKSKVNDKQLHVVHNQPIAFTNPEAEDKSKITATITMSIAIQGPGDDAVQLKMGTDPDAAKYKPWMPASVEKKYKQLSLKIIRAEYIPEMDAQMLGVGNIGDPYIFIDHMGTKLRSKTLSMEKDGENPWAKPVEFNEEMLLPLEIPVSNDNLRALFYDYEAVGRDELICGLNFSKKQLIKDADCSKNPKGPDGKIQITPRMRWINMYGCNVQQTGMFNTSKSSKEMEKQNMNEDEASTFKGRLLVEYYTIDEKAPLMKVQMLKNTPEFEARLESMRELDYQIFAEVRSGICLPDSKEYKILISCGEMSWTSEAPKQGIKQKLQNYCRWSYRVSETFKSPHQHLETFPFVYIYLVDPDGVPICFWKGNPADFTDKKAQPRWVQLTPDLAIGKVTKAHVAGMIQFRLCFHACQVKQRDGSIVDKQPLTEADIFKKDIPKRANAFKIRAYIYQAESLPPCDASGASDPYIQVWTPGEEDIRTAVVEQTNNPIYYEVKDFMLEFNELDDAPPIILNFFDTDEGGMFSLLGDDDDYMGRAIIFLDEIGDPNDESTHLATLDRIDTIPQPTWYPVKFSMNAGWSADNGARVLVSFAQSEFHESFALEPEEVLLNEEMMIPEEGNEDVMVPVAMPNLQIRPMSVEINVLGFRDLVSTGLLPIKKAFAKFSVKSLLPPAQGKAVSEIFTQPGEGGSDPNVRTTLKFEVRIPSEPFFTPRMTCMAYDKLYFDGMKQPILGTFTLKLGDILAAGREADSRTVKEADLLTEILRASLEAKGGKQSKRTMLDIVTEQQSLRAGGEGGNLALRQAEIAVVVEEGVAALAEEAEEVANMTPEEKEAWDKLQQKKKERAEAKAEHLRAAAEKKAAEEAKRQAAQEELAGGRDGAANRIWPKYKFDERLGVDREVEMPPENLFMEIGYNRKKGDTIKHYRRYYCDELEKVNEVMPPSPFLMEPMYKMEQEGAGLFGGGSDDSENNVAIKTGYFKGLVKVYSKPLKEEREKKIDTALEALEGIVKDVYEIQMKPKKFEFDFKSLAEANPGERYKELKGLCRECGIGGLKIDEYIQNYRFGKDLVKRLNETVKAKTKIYLIEGFNFASKDLFSLSDPYLVIKCGKDKVSERDNYQDDTMEPTFHKCYEFNVSFPGSPVVVIEAWDYDLLFGDDFIGHTKLDLDDRFFNKEWCGIAEKPIEYRELYHPTSSISQGVVKMWCEIDRLDNKRSSMKSLDITPEPQVAYEMRFIIWGTKDLETMDFEGTTDAYFRSFVDDKDEHFTDTHWRCQTGEANFNWRHLINVYSRKPDDHYKLTIQGYDKDIFSSDEVIGEFVLDIKPIFEDAYLTDKLQVLSKEYWDTYMRGALEKQGVSKETLDQIKWDSNDKKEECFWVPLIGVDQENPDNIKSNGIVKCSLRIYPEALAKKNEQGKGRDTPNNDPVLPEPEGRIQLSLNPFTMFNQLVGPAVRRKIYMCICCLACAALCAFMAPMIISNGFSKLLFG